MHLLIVGKRSQRYLLIGTHCRPGHRVGRTLFLICTLLQLHWGGVKWLTWYPMDISLCQVSLVRSNIYERHKYHSQYTLTIMCILAKPITIAVTIRVNWWYTRQVFYAMGNQRHTHQRGLHSLSIRTVFKRHFLTILMEAQIGQHGALL